MSYYKRKTFVLVNGFQFLGILILLLVTVYGLTYLAKQDWHNVMILLNTRGKLIGIAIFLRIIDWVLDYLLWRFVVLKYDIKIGWKEGVCVYLTQGAGILLPAQLGRVLRSLVITKIKGISVITSMSVEFFFLICVTVGSFIVLLISIGVWSGHLPVFIILSCICLAIFSFLKKIKISFLNTFWGKIFNPKISAMELVFLCLCSGLGWFLNGLIFYLILGFKDSPLTLSQTQIVVLGNLLIGMLSGIPGGLGVVETTLGISLHWLKVETLEMIVGILLFRIITFWCWIPLGWIALFMLNVHKEIFKMDFVSRNSNDHIN